MKREFLAKTQGLTDLINYAALVEEGICLLKDGSLMAGFMYRGHDLDAADSQTLEFLSAQVNQTLCQLGDGWMFHVDMLRLPSCGYPEENTCHFPDATSKLIDEERRKDYHKEDAHFESRYVMTFTYQTPTETDSRIQNWLVKGNEVSSLHVDKVVRYFVDTISKFENTLSNYLHIVKLNSQQLLTHLHTFITSLTHQLHVPTTPVYLDSLLASQDLTAGLNPKIGDQYIKVISMTGLPLESEPGLLNLFEQLPLSFRWSNRFIFLDPNSANKEYTSSVIISDFKLENWHLTAGFRQKMGHRVLKFDPTCTDGTGARFTPLFEIRRGEHEVRDAQLIADMLVDPDGKRSKSHWDNSANSLLVSVILHVLYSETDKSLAGVRTFLCNPDQTQDELLQKMLASPHHLVASGAREMLNKEDEERSGIVSSAQTFLKLYRDPIIADNTRGHDFTIRDLVYGEKPVSLYLGMPPSDIERTMPFMRLMLQLILSRLTESLEIGEPSQRRQLLLMLDEFPQFGRLSFFERSLSYSAGYNIRAYLISQDMQQIYKEYGRDQSIVSNCGSRVAYAPNTLETAKLLSESLGYTTLLQKQVNYSGNRFNGMLKHMNISDHEIKRALLMPDELMRLPQHAALIFKNGMATIYGHKIYYYQDYEFSNRASIKPPTVSDKFQNEVVWIGTQPTAQISSIFIG